MPNPYYDRDGIVIYHGDCHKLLPQLASEGAELFLTDPPFGIDYQNNFTKTPHEKLTGDDALASYLEWGREAFRVLKNDSALFAFTGWSEYPHHFTELAEAGFRLQEPLIVQKRASGKTNLHGSFQTNSDWLLFAHKGRFRFRSTTLARNKRAGTVPNPGRRRVGAYKTRMPSCWFGGDYPWSTANHAKQNHCRHPTRKTVELMQWLIQLTTDKGALVVDPFMGCGATLVAARLLGRRAIGIEVAEKYCEGAVNELEQLGDEKP